MTPEKNDATVLLRLPTELKAALTRAAIANGRRITAEINMRLANSLVLGDPHAYMRAEEPLDKRDLPGNAYLAGISQREKAALDAFRKLSAEKQLALLALLK